MSDCATFGKSLYSTDYNETEVNYKYMFLLRNLFLCLILLCAFTISGAYAQTRADITVYAAASMKESLDALARQFERQAGGKVVVSYGASPSLARQIEKGAPADLFISADRDWMDYLDQRKLIRAGSRVNLLSNRLVLIAPADSKAVLAIAPKFPLAQSLGSSRLAMADPDSVPAGKYGKVALEVLGVWSAVAPKIARAENVRAALALVARGEVPFGIVYITDAMAEPKVRVIGTFPANLHSPMVYPAALLADGRSQSAEALLRFLRSVEARTVWRKFGFVVEAGER
jgi:molybdate transport system substrate-binding protein